MQRSTVAWCAFLQALRSSRVDLAARQESTELWQQQGQRGGRLQSAEQNVSGQVTMVCIEWAYLNQQPMAASHLLYSQIHNSQILDPGSNPVHSGRCEPKYTHPRVSALETEHHQSLSEEMLCDLYLVINGKHQVALAVWYFYRWPTRFSH